MPHLFIQFLFNILEAIFFQLRGDSPYSVAEIPDRIIFAAHEQQRELSRNIPRPISTRCFRVHRDQRMETVVGEWNAAQRIAVERQAVCFVQTEPAGGGGVWFVPETDVVHLVEHFVDQLVTFPWRYPVQKPDEGFGEDGRDVFPAGSHDDCAVEFLGGFLQQQAGDEGTHGMTQYEFWNVGMEFAQVVRHLSGIFHELSCRMISLEKAEVGRISCGFSMTEMVVSEYGKSISGKKTRKFLIPAAVFLHAVQNQHGGSHRLIFRREMVVKQSPMFVWIAVQQDVTGLMTDHMLDVLML